MHLLRASRRITREPMKSTQLSIFIQTIAIATSLGALSTLRADEFTDLLATFGIIETIAGTGVGPDRGNSWLATMEEGPAVNASLSRPHMAMQDDAGNVYIADKEAHGIRKITPNGTIRTVAGTSVLGNGGEGLGPEVALDNPNGLYTLPDGTTYILDLGNAKIRVLSPDGQLTTLISDPDGLGLGRALWVSPDQNLIYYSGPGRIQRWRRGEGIDIFATGFSELGNIEVDTNGTVYATDRGTHLVSRVSESGSLVTVAGQALTSNPSDGTALGTDLNEVRGIAFEPSTGGYYVATHRSSQIWYVDTENKIHLMIDGDRDDDTHAGDGRPIQEPGEKISEPRAITVAPNGDLLITENDRGFIRRVHKLRSETARPDIIRTQLTAAGMELTWQSTPAQRYQVEFSTVLTNWQTLAEISGTSDSESTHFIDSNANTQRSGYYRIHRID